MTFPAPAVTQAPAALGTWRGCFSAAGYNGTACGLVTLAPADVCRPAGDQVGEGRYYVRFDSLAAIGTDMARVLPPRDGALTWRQPAPDRLEIANNYFPAQSAGDGHPVCVINDRWQLELQGRTSGDSLVGRWVWYEEGGRRTEGELRLRKES